MFPPPFITRVEPTLMQARLICPGPWKGRVTVPLRQARVVGTVMLGGGPCVVTVPREAVFVVTAARFVDAVDAVDPVEPMDVEQAARQSPKKEMTISRAADTARVYTLRMAGAGQV